MERKSTITCSVFAVIVLIVLFIVFRGINPFHGILMFFYLNPIPAFGLVALTAFIVSASVAADTSNNGYLTGLFAVLAGASLILVLFWSIASKPYRMVGLYRDTDYKQVDQLISVKEPRPVSYAEAKTNFSNQNPEARFGPGDLDYVRGEWIAEFGPSTLWNKYIAPTQGFFVYKPDEQDKVQIVRQEMPFAERGLLWNSLRVFIHSKDPFVQYSEVLYIEDPDGGYMAMTTLIKRSGWRRVPYVHKVLIVHANRDAEWLSPEIAKEDERLDGIQLVPEWFAKMQVEAYGWRNGAGAGLFTKRGRIEVQNSIVNEENSAPYHLETQDGPMWYTPYGPLNKDSMKGIMMQDSHDASAPVLIWSLSGDQAYQGVDALATEVKAAPGHPGSINWLRVSKVEGGSARSGDTDIIEMIPVPKTEGDEVVLYFMGYVAIDPPVSTRFYSIINAENREVLEDVYTIDEVSAWLSGEKELKVQTDDLRTNGLVPNSSDELFFDLPSLSVEDLLNLLRQVTDELERRSINQ